MEIRLARSGMESIREPRKIEKYILREDMNQWKRNVNHPDI